MAQDAAYIKPITTSYIMITPGQTMDILVTANQAPSYYYIAASPFFDSSAPYDETNTSAILQYTGTYTIPTTIPYPTLPNVTDKAAADNFTTRIRSLASAKHPVYVPKKVTTRIFITVSVNQIVCANASCGGPSGNRLSASLNNISFVTPSTDVLQAYYKYVLHLQHPVFIFIFYFLISFLLVIRTHIYFAVFLFLFFFNQQLLLNGYSMDTYLVTYFNHICQYIIDYIIYCTVLKCGSKYFILWKLKTLTCTTGTIDMA